jgi:predicted permease
MSPLVQTIALVFGLVALGYGAGLSGYLKAELGEALAEFCVAIALPLLLFRTMVNTDFAGSAPWLLWAVYFSAVAIAWTAGQLVTTKVFKRDRRAGIVGGMASAFSNLVLLGMPFMLGTFGKEGFAVLSLLVCVHLPIMTAVSMLQFQWADRGSRPPIGVWRFAALLLRNLACNPLIVGILAGLTWRFSALGLPDLAVRFVDALANVAAPVALFAIGLSLRRFGISGNILPALAVTAVKLFVMPAAALVLAKLCGLPPLTAKVAVVAAALPSGVNPFLIASMFGTGQALASNAMTLATAGAVLTTAFWVFVAQLTFG